MLLSFSFTSLSVAGDDHVEWHVMRIQRQFLVIDDLFAERQADELHAVPDAAGGEQPLQELVVVAHAVAAAAALPRKGHPRKQNEVQSA